VDRRDASELDAAQFLATYLLPNRPLLLTGATRGWRASAEWVAPGGAPDVDALSRLFGDDAVQVADCAAPEDAPRLRMTVAAYVAYWRAHAAGRDSRVLYLKDWHCAAAHPDYLAYAPPPLFGADALNGYYDARRGGSAEVADYRFVYLGVKGSATPLHADVLHSASWSANVAGVKSWLLFPPHATPLLRDARGNLPADAAAALAAALAAPADAGTSASFPRLADAAPLALRVTQRAGEALFVPSGWHHQVRNDTAALSINHNWAHPAALHWLHAFVRDDAAAAARAIEDLRAALPAAEFAGLVQRNTAANAGLDFAQLAACAWRAARGPLATLCGDDGGGGGGDGARARAAAALACARCGAVLRALAVEPAHCFVHHAEDGAVPVAPAAWADALADALRAAGFPGC
jgi:hypothetical protein